MYKKREPTKHELATLGIIEATLDWDVPRWKAFRSLNNYWEVMKVSTSRFGIQSTEFKELKLSWIHSFNKSNIKY